MSFNAVNKGEKQVETKRKKKLWNMVMVVLILVIAASAVLTVGKIKGWFEKKEDIILSSGMLKGVVDIQRNGIGYTLNPESALQRDDLIETKKGAQAELVWRDQSRVTLNEKSEIMLLSCQEEESHILISKGEIFGNMAQHQDALQITFAESKAMLQGAVFSVSMQTGSSTLNIFAGDVSVFLSDGTQERVETGEMLSVVNNKDDTLSYQIQKIQPASLNEFQIAQVQECDNEEELCFTTEELQAVLNNREAEKKKALEEALKSETVSAEEKETVGAKQKPEVSDQETEHVESDAEEYTSDGISDESRESNVCTITIRCDTILDNLDNLDAGKEVYVPSNGVILETSSVEFEEGETVFDVLTRVCKYADIQIEYAWTPLYDSYYIESINHLYEFDCGNESGWMYKVNGWFPNYGCSDYTLENGDNIVWCYTCNGYGADVE